MVKKKLNWLLVVLILNIALVGCSKTADINLQQLTDEERGMLQYLQENHSSINLEDEDEFADLAILDSEIKDKEIFLTGEVHGVKANEELHMRFLKYFKDRTDFIYYLCESSYSSCYFINKYLETGDVRILEDLYRPLKGTFAWNKDSYNHCKALREYNNSLPDDRKIQVIGVDIEHQIDTAYRYLLDVLPNQEPPKKIKAKIDGLRVVLNDIRDDIFLQRAQELLRDMEEKESVYREYLGEDFIGFKLVNSNILNAYEAYPRSAVWVHWNNTRDKMIYENFKLLQNELPPGKYFGQWGRQHIYQSEEGNVMWFGAYLNSEGSLFKDKVLSIAYLYDNCEVMGKGDYPAKPLSVIPNPIKKMNDLIGGDLSMYSLIGAPSFLSEPITYGVSATEKLVTDFYQYIVCIKNSKATEPLNDEYD